MLSFGSVIYVRACMHTCEKLLRDVISVVYKVLCSSKHLLAK